jgi:predicted nucleic acid-binding protein
MATDFKDILRRIKPEKHRRQLQFRAKSNLEFIDFAGSGTYRKLLYDTTVYIDVLQDRFPHPAEIAMRSADAWHSTVTESELAALCGILDPAHAGTRVVIEQVMAMIQRRPLHRSLAPDREIWQESGVLAGTLARLQNYKKTERRRAMNDALIFSTAKKYGLTVLTRNVDDFDLLQQLEPAGRILFYSV